MLYSVDRLEGDVAVLVDEDGNNLSLPLHLLPAHVRAGTMLRREGEELILAPEEEVSRRRRVLELQRRLRDKTKTEH